jgi:BASS family bile acid:Na+ symporter
MIEDNFWVFLLLGMLMGFVFSDEAAVLDHYLVVLLMALLYVVFLKNDMGNALGHIRRPLLLLYLLACNLLVIPVLVFVFTRGLEPDLKVAVFLLACMPSGISAPALTDIVKGDTALSLVLTVLSSMIAPLSITGLLYVLYGTAIPLDYTRLFLGLVAFTLVPLLASEVTKRCFSGAVERCKGHLGALSVLILMVTVTVVIGKEADYIRSNIADVFHVLLVLYAVFFAFQAAGYFQAFWLKPDERLAVSVSKMAMNNVLGMVIAISYFNPRIALILVLSEIPWNTMPILYSLFRKIPRRM